MTIGQEIELALKPFLAAEQIEVAENGKRVGAFAPFRYEVSTKGSQTLLHLWSEERNLVRGRLTNEVRITTCNAMS